MAIHLYHPHVDLADAGVVGSVAVGPDLHKGHAKFKLVLCCIERLREIRVHVLQHSVDNEIWLLVEDHLLHFQESVRADCQADYYGQDCTNWSLKCSSTLEIEIDRRPKQVEPREEVAEVIVALLFVSLLRIIRLLLLLMATLEIARIVLLVTHVV